MQRVDGKHLLDKRRQKEDVVGAMQRSITEDKRTLQVARFESLSSLKIEKKMIKERAKELRDDASKNLEYRRQQLADLYNDEMEEWKAEVMSNVETQEDRKARIMERAYALRDAREVERQKVVQQKYQDQWREACDDVRILDSKALNLHMGRERVQQIQDKIARKQQINKEESAIMAEFNRNLEREKEKDDERKAQLYQNEVYTRMQLQEQIHDNLLRKDREYARLQAEADEELYNIRESLRIESERMKRRQEEARSRGREVYEYNQQFKVLEMEEERIQKYHDKILLDYALARERENEREDNHKKQAMRQSAVQYAEYLREQTTKEADQSAYVDDIHRQEQEKVWQARDDELQQRQDAKDYLMRMVDDGRREQIRSRQDQAQREKEEQQQYGRRFLANARDGVEAEREEAIRRKNVRLDDNDKLLDQMAYRRLKDEKEKQDIYLEEKRMKYVEREHQQRLGVQGGAIRTNFPLKSGQWYS